MTHFSDLEMDVSEESSIPKLKELQIHSSCVPVTPVKPNVQRPHSTCTERRENQLGLENKSAREILDLKIAAYCESLKSFDIQNIKADIEAMSQSFGGDWNCSVLSMEPDRLKSGPFANLRTLVAVENNSANATKKGNLNAASTSIALTFDSTCEGNQLESASTTSSLANEGISLGSNMQSYSSHASITPLHGNYTHPGPACDLNLIPRTPTYSSRNIPSQFSPKTPDQSKKAENKESRDILNLNEDERENQESEKQGNNVGTSEFEIEELPKDSSSTAVSTHLHENHNPDMVGNLAIDLNTTPQQKPRRRRKHRPKVVVEGKPKRTQNPAGLADSPTAKRKYVRKNIVGKTPGTPTAEAASGTTDPEPAPLADIPTAKRKYVRKNKLEKPGTPAAEAPNGTTDPKQGPLADTPTGKRKYDQKNKVDKTPGTPAPEATSRTTDPEPGPAAAKFCKRKLNFEPESQVTEEYSSSTLHSNTNAESESHAQNFYTRLESNSNEQTQVGMAYELTCSMNKAVKDCIEFQKRRAPSPEIPTRTDLLHENWKARDQNAHIEGKCRIVFSDDTHDKQESIIQGMSYEGEQAKRLESGNSCMSNVVEPSRTNVSECRYNALRKYRAILPADIYNNIGIPGMYFPASYKRKRNERGHNSTTSSTLSTVTVGQNTVRQVIPWSMNNTCAACSLATAKFMPGSIPIKTASIIGAQGKEKNLECKLALNQEGIISMKRAKGLTPIGNFGSLIEFVQVRHRPTFAAEGAPTLGVMPVYGNLHHPPTSMDATMKIKKQTKRKPFAGSEAIQMKMPSTDELAEQLKGLDITNQEQRSLAPYYIRYEEQSALVVYQRDGTVMPFEGSFDPVRRRKPRPKVNLDEETNRVWKLLLENINNEGIDGTDEEKAKWWEEERRVFRGRADSFIARMHLVQGDRRFSPWKGSVLDSAIGVFLTQNVSDHLSSSAFMSLAARFPLKSNSNERPCFVGTSVLDKDTEVCVTDPEDTITWEWHEDNSNQPACNRNSVTFHDTDYFSEKVVDCYESVGSSSGGENSVDNLECKTSDISGDGLEKYDEPTADRKVIQPKQAVASSTGNNIELDDVRSSQCSGSSSQNSVNLSMAQTAARTESSFHGNSEAADPGLRPNPNSLVGSSFMELLKRQEEIFYNQKTGNVLSYEANGYSGTERGKQNQSVQEVSNLSRDTLAATESTGVITKPKNTEHNEVESCLIDRGNLPGMAISGTSSDSSKVKRGRIGEQKQSTEDWDGLRLQAQAKGRWKERTTNTMDSVDWEAVRCADVNEIAYTIRERGMNNRLAERIKDFLNRLVQEHGSIDLEWLRDVPPDKAKEYLLSVRGLGLKSVECVRLLTLHHLAFPVDTNVGRIAVRLGWVPLQPLPESLQLHLLELYPVLESIQRYLWPRLCKLDQRTLYQLHYQMITFGKVFCTKSKPNCNACPMRGECRHFASAFASARLALPGPEEKNIVSTTESKAANRNPVEVIKPLQLPVPQANQQLQAHSQLNSCEPIVEIPATPEPIIEVPATPEPIIEVPGTPEPEQPEVLERDIEDAFYEDPEEIPMIKLNIEEFTQNLQHYMQHNMELCEGDISKALVALTPEAASIPVPKLKYINRLRTEHQVYELPDSHPLLEGLDNREPDDPCSYLLAIWTPGETANSIEAPEMGCSSQECGMLCDEHTCFSCNNIREANSQIVRGTILIPCRTAMRGSFPLNGTYFQVNEVFADHESSINPIDVPRAWLWNLPRRTVYFGTSVPTIFRGLSTESIQHCFWRGFVCVRGFERKTRAPRPLMARLHFPASKLKGNKVDTNVRQEQ